jgi:hypothetical protein
MKSQSVQDRIGITSLDELPKKQAAEHQLALDQLKNNFDKYITQIVIAGGGLFDKERLFTMLNKLAANDLNEGMVMKLVTQKQFQQQMTNQIARGMFIFHHPLREIPLSIGLGMMSHYLYDAQSDVPISNLEQARIAFSVYQAKASATPRKFLINDEQKVEALGAGYPYDQLKEFIGYIHQCDVINTQEKMKMVKTGEGFLALVDTVSKGDLAKLFEYSFNSDNLERYQKKIAVFIEKIKKNGGVAQHIQNLDMSMNSELKVTSLEEFQSFIDLLLNVHKYRKKEAQLPYEREILIQSNEKDPQR